MTDSFRQILGFLGTSGSRDQQGPDSEFFLTSPDAALGVASDSLGNTYKADSSLQALGWCLCGFTA